MYHDAVDAPNIRPPWWLWPNLVALDAPVVAVVWQQFLAAAFGLTLPVAASVSLALAVWGVYLLDRGLDARPGRPTDPADRHRFARRHRSKLLIVGGVILAGAVIVALGWLPPATLVDGTLVGLALASYFAAVHAVGLPGGGKELAVGLVFAAGVAVPLAARLPHRVSDWGPPVVGFAAICWLNCRLIDRWEHNQSIGSGPAVAGLIAVVASIWARTPWPVGGAIVGAVFILIVLHLLRHRLGPQLLRVGADVALLTPLAVWGWL